MSSILNWRGTDFKWESVSVDELLKTPKIILDLVAFMKPPARVLKDNVFQFGLDQVNTIESFEMQKESVKVNLKPMNTDSRQITKTRSKINAVIAVVLSKENGLSLGLPKFRK